MHEYRLKIDVFTVDRLPMSRLAEYMGELARLLGERDSVHFSRLEEGSAVLVSRVEDQALPKVAERLHCVQVGSGPKDAMKAFRTLDALLAKDNATAVLIPPDSTNVIEFPGRNRPAPVRYGPFLEYGTLDGVLIRIGGKDQTIPVWLKDGDAEYYCHVRSEEVARQLAPHYLRGTLRVHGTGKWVREENGTWALEMFDIDHFEPLDDSPLSEVVRKLQAVEGSEWHESDDAIRDVLALRHGPGEPH